MKPAKVLVVVFDGLRADHVTEELAPNITGFRDIGVHVANTASSFPSETRVQVSTVMTGHPAAGHGIMANAFYDPALGFDGPMDTSDDEKMGKAAKIYGRLMTSHHLAEVLWGAGKKFAAVTTGKIGNARLLAGRAQELGQPVLSIWGDSCSTYDAKFAEVEKQFGAVPKTTFPNIGQTDWATKVMLEHTLPVHKPDVAVLWLNDPDMSYHYAGTESEEAKQAIAACDAAFGRILDWWNAEGREEGWHIVAMSDHGHVTVTRQINIIEALKAEGLSAGLALGPDVDFAVKRSYSAQISVRDRKPALIDRLIATLRNCEWAGPIFARERFGSETGALPFSVINYGHPRAADVAFTLWASDEPAVGGLPGICFADNGDIPLGGGMHGGIQKAELNHCFFLGGDKFRTATKVETPSGHVDLAPTILSLLDLAPEFLMPGRALSEAMIDGEAAPDVDTLTHQMGKDGYQQEVTISRVAGAKLPYLRYGARTR